MSKYDQADSDATLPDALTDESVGENVLLLTSYVGDQVDTSCMDHILEEREQEPAVILVTLNESPRRRLQALRKYNDRLPARISVICSTESLGRSSADINGVDVTTIADPSDLARLGVKISDVLSELADRPIALCFHSLTDLIRLVELSRVFRFVYTLGGRVTASGARAHYHLDPSAHDNQVLSTLQPLFDTVVGESNGNHHAPNPNADSQPTDTRDSDHDPWNQLLEDDR